VATPHSPPCKRGPRERASRPSVFVVGHTATETNAAVVEAMRRQRAPVALVPPQVVSERTAVGDIVLGRLDVLPTLDGVEPGIWHLRGLERRGVKLLNTSAALLASHDKLATSILLARAGVPHPRTANVDGDAGAPVVEPPVVVKPRFGSWGRDVYLCETAEALGRLLQDLRGRRWFDRHGALVQELVPSDGVDLRLVVAGGRVVGGVERVAPAGEWRTNVALGARRVPIAAAPPEAGDLAVRAADAVAGDLVGVDLLAGPAGGWLVLEVNGAVEFTPAYSLPGRCVFDDVAAALFEVTGDVAALASA
jgi:RimK family alpha-L-glutamate ligase